MKVNIEGCEYELLEALLREGLMERVKELQVQFHPFVEGAFAKREAIRRGLARTHEVVWEYPFVWEDWRRRAANGRGPPKKPAGKRRG